jgi:hypothetical protein
MKSLRLCMNQAPSFVNALRPEELKRARDIEAIRRAEASRLQNPVSRRPTDQ